MSSSSQTILIQSRQLGVSLEFRSGRSCRKGFAGFTATPAPRRYAIDTWLGSCALLGRTYASDPMSHSVVPNIDDLLNQFISRRRLGDRLEVEVAGFEA
jgi:hypothetical protein